jgi:hypothetical protein
MRQKLLRILSLFVVGGLALPATAQPPAPTPGPLPTEVQPLPNPDTIPNGNPGIVQGAPPPISANIVGSTLGCGDGCCNPTGYWTISGGIYYMRPFIGSNPAIFTSSGIGTPLIINHQADFSQRFNVAPTANLGYTFGNGWGIRGHWDQFSSNGSSSANVPAGGSIFPASGNPIVGTPGPASALASSNVRLSVFDLESTYTSTWGQWSYLVGGGLRYAAIKQSYELDVTPTGGALNFFTAEHNFSGLGPTAAFEARRQIGCSCISVYGTVRGSLLFGWGSQNSVSGINGAETIAGGGSSASVIPIGEGEVGIEASHSWGRFRVFVQFGVVGQVWWGVGNASTGLDLSTGGTSSNNNIGFVGGVVRAGVNF